MSTSMETTRPAPFADALPWLAFGLVAGISLLAQPVKFLTPGLSLAELVSVGATIFKASHAVQAALLVLMALVVPPRKLDATRSWLCLAACAAILAFQQTILMPPMDTRLALLQAGAQPPPSWHHAAYVVLEVSKLATLFLLGRLPGARVAETTTRRRSSP